MGKPEWQIRKLHTVTASNNRDHPTRSLYYCLFVPYTVYISFFFAHIPFMVNRTFNTTSTERLQKQPFFLQQTTPIAHSFCEGCMWHDLHITMVTASCVFKGRRARYLPRAPPFWGPPSRCFARKFSLFLAKNLLSTHIIIYYKADHK